MTRWRIGIKWVVIALALALAISVLARFLGLIPNIQLQPQNVAQTIILAVVYLVAAVFEELGWRGFALARLLDRRSPAFAGLVLGVPRGIIIHIVLHLPGMWAEGLPWLPTVVQLIALSVVITWLFVSSGHSILLVSLFHAAQSAFGFVKEGIAPAGLHWLMTVVWSAVAGLVLISVVSAIQKALPDERAAAAP